MVSQSKKNYKSYLSDDPDFRLDQQVAVIDTFTWGEDTFYDTSWVLDADLYNVNPDVGNL